MGYRSQINPQYFNNSLMTTQIFPVTDGLILLKYSFKILSSISIEFHFILLLSPIVSLIPY